MCDFVFDMLQEHCLFTYDIKINAPFTVCVSNI